MTREIVLDTETTGLSPKQGHRIIEVGCLEIVNRRLTDRKFHYYINPQRDIDEGAQAVHGISIESLQDKPLFSQIIDELIEFIDGAKLIAHNAPFDVGFLNHEFMLAGKQYQQIKDYCTVFDTLALAKRKHPGQRNNLDALCKRYGIDNSNRNLHGALLDADLLAGVYFIMTGGQTTLSFDGGKTVSAEKMKRDAVVKKKTAAEQAASPVIAPSTDELAAHQAFMEKLAIKD